MGTVHLWAKRKKGQGALPSAFSRLSSIYLMRRGLTFALEARKTLGCQPRRRQNRRLRARRPNLVPFNEGSFLGTGDNQGEAASL